MHRRQRPAGARCLVRADGATTADPASIAEIFAAHNERIGDPARFAEGEGFSDTRRRAVERGVRRVLAKSHTVAPKPHLDGPFGMDETFAAVCQLHNGTAASPLDNVSSALLKKGTGACLTCCAPCLSYNGAWISTHTRLGWSPSCCTRGRQPCHQRRLLPLKI
jgi:hypothetical protein